MWPLVVLLLLLLPPPVWSDGGFPPPTDVHVHDSLLVWSAAPAHPNATYTVQYRGLDTKGWQNVSSCVRNWSTFCDVEATMSTADIGCVRLHVHAHYHSLTSDSVEACSQQETSCSPKIQLSAQPNALTVHLSRRHPLITNHGAAIQYLVSYAKEGEPLQAYKKSPSSVEIAGLDGGHRYCVAVVFSYYNTPIAPPSCAKCLDIPQSVPVPVPVPDVRVSTTLIIVGVVLAVAGVVLVLLVVYVVLFQSWRIKAWMRPPYTMPKCITDELAAQPQRALVYSPRKESCDHISSIFPLEDPQPSTWPPEPHRSSSLMEL